MPRRSRSRTGSRRIEEAPEALLVDDPGPLLERCKRALEAVLPEAGRMGFHQQDLARGEREYLLVSEAQSRAKARNEYPALPLLATVDSAFWFAVALRFGPSLGRFQLKHVSILLFEGLASDPNKIPLVRAEWDEADPSGSHAQPHWHVYSSALMKPEPVLFEETAEADPDGAGEDAAGSTLEGDRFHYAMSATWHLDGGSHQSRLSEDKLLRWLPGCVRYTRNQLLYLSGG